MFKIGNIQKFYDSGKIFCSFGFNVDFFNFFRKIREIKTFVILNKINAKLKLSKGEPVEGSFVNSPVFYICKKIYSFHYCIVSKIMKIASIVVKSEAYNGTT